LPRKAKEQTMLTNLQATTIDHFGMGMGSYDEARRTAAKLFDKVYGRGLRERLFVKINDKAHELRPLSHWPEAASRTVSTVVVPLNKIVGTESRSDDFDADFHPLKKHNRERWISVAASGRTGAGWKRVLRARWPSPDFCSQGDGAIGNRCPNRELRSTSATGQGNPVTEHEIWRPVLLVWN
jgi:hypothetical protein